MTDQLTTRGLVRSAASLVAAAFALLVVLSAGSVQAATVTVAAVNYEFQPASRTIAVGDTVHWTFAGEPHWVTARDGSFDSGLTNPGGSFQFKFTKAGTYPYYCQIHPEQMVGTIVVKASASPKPTVASTPRPTPRPSARPTSTPTPAPTPTPAASPTLAPSPIPSATAGASLALLETPATSSAPASPGPDAVAPTGAIDAAPIAVLLVLLGVLVGGGLIVARGRRAR